jgi:hypothetical protein
VLWLYIGELQKPKIRDSKALKMEAIKNATFDCLNKMEAKDIASINMNLNNNSIKLDVEYYMEELQNNNKI